MNMHQDVRKRILVMLTACAVAITTRAVAQADVININATGFNFMYNGDDFQISDPDDSGGNLIPDEARTLTRTEFMLNGNLVKQYRESDGEDTYADLLISNIAPALTLPSGDSPVSLSQGDNNGFGFDWFYDDGGTVRNLRLNFEEVTVALYFSENFLRPTVLVSGTTSSWSQSNLPGGIAFDSGSEISFSFWTSDTIVFEYPNKLGGLLGIDGVIQLHGEGHGVEPQPPSTPIIGGFGDLPRIETHTLPADRKRAEQGIVWVSDAWVTSQGFVHPLVANSDRLLSRFTEDWSALITTHEEIAAVEHIGDVAWSGTYVYAPLQIDDTFGLSSLREKVARFDPVTLTNVGEWDVPNNTQIAGLEYFNGKLFGVEYVESGDANAALVSVLDEQDPSQLLSSFSVAVDYANGIAIDEATGRVYVTSGTYSKLGALGFKEVVGEIHVFDLATFLSAAPGQVLVANNPAHGYGVYSYDVPDDLHAEGIAIRPADQPEDANQLWVALGRDVAWLNTSPIADSKTMLESASGDWSVVVNTGTSQGSTVIGLASSNVRVDGMAEAHSAYITGGTILTVGNSSHLLLNHALSIDAGRVQLSGGSLSVGTLVIGGGGGNSGVLATSADSTLITVSSRVILEQGGTLEISNNAAIEMTGSNLENRSTSGADYADLTELAFIFRGGPNVVDLFEVAGRAFDAINGSPDASDFIFGNLQIGTAEFIGKLLLVDVFDNQPATMGSDVLYVNSLEVRPGSILYLNDLSLYVAGVRVNPGEGALYGGGIIANTIPEPTSLMLALLCATLTAGRCAARRHPLDSRCDSPQLTSLAADSRLSDTLVVGCHHTRFS